MKMFIFFAMLSAFFICGEYSMIRPASNALFLTLFSSKAYPWVWLATVPFNLLIIYLYNRFLPKIGPLAMISTFAFAAIGINVFVGIFYTQIPWLIFFQYIWKDIYILFMLKQLWSMIHSTVNKESAKYLYGFIYGTGTLGAISGSLIPSFLAVEIGTEKILFFTLPVYLLLLFTYSMAYKRSKITPSFTQELTTDSRPREAFALIRRSKVLIASLLLVVLMQVSVGLMEYRFNAELELNIIDRDLRAAYCGKLIGLVNALSLIFQFLGAFLMLRILGTRRSQFLIPGLLCFSTLISLAIPSFGVLSLSYVFFKAIDFSLFGVIREMLYVPLQLDEKFRAKAIIDVFAYRTSKAVVSLALIILQAIAGIYLLQIASWLSVALFIAWFAVVIYFFRSTANNTNPIYS